MNAATGQSSRPLCPGCGTPLGAASVRATGGERAPSGDDYADALHHCSVCGAWSVVTVVDRFCGPEETRVHGPLTDEDVRDRLSAMRER